MAGLIPPQKLEEIRAASDIVDVIGGYLGPLKRAGANFVTLCPFHREKSPSFNVNPGRQIFHCFGCHKGGDVFTFVKEYENLSFIEAVRRLAERARIVLEFEDNPHAKQARGEKESLLHLHEEICKRWQTALANDAAGQIARDYLAKRGVSAEAVKLFRLGYAPDLWDDTVNWAKSKNFDLKLVERGGLVIRKEGADHFYDRFRGRLMFPICDEQGRVIGFSGRVLAGDEKTAKYVNSPETPIFTKGRVIFGLDKSKRAVADKDCAIICEGQLDLIACFMADVKNVVAPQGTALTADHCRILKRYADEVVLCFDSDNAGQNAAVRSLDILLASGLAIRVATVPAPHDPDSYIKANGGPAFEQLIERAENFFDYYLNRLCVQNDLGADKGRLAVLHAMGEATQKTGNAVLIDTYAQKTAARLGVAPEAARAEFKKIAAAKPKFVLRTDAQPAARAGGLQPPSTAPGTPKRGDSKSPAPDPDSPPDDYYDSQPAAPSEGHSGDVLPGTDPAPEPEAPPSKQEFWLLQALFHSDDQMEWLANTLRLEWLTHLGVRQIVAHRLAGYANQSWHGPAQLLGELPDDAARSLCTQAMAESDRMLATPQPREGEDAARATRIQAEREKARLAMLRDVLTRLRNDFIDRRMSELNRELNAPQLEDSEQNSLLREREQLRQQKKQPLA
ncbi:MAG: DNA primase [Limisphaerales bacterium]|nr:MAG: DNA primase [Limisphaerales bacterium]KAG0510080.1 MAG: DNA primase [Limisphaerales bacterium]TXT52923.1 MAG: DNA primase [Limisphaerales bacterium]